MTNLWMFYFVTGMTIHKCMWKDKGSKQEQLSHQVLPIPYTTNCTLAIREASFSKQQAKSITILLPKRSTWFIAPENMPPLILNVACKLSKFRYNVHTWKNNTNILAAVGIIVAFLFWIKANRSGYPIFVSYFCATAYFFHIILYKFSMSFSLFVLNKKSWSKKEIC